MKTSSLPPQELKLGTLEIKSDLFPLVVLATGVTGLGVLVFVRL